MKISSQRANNFGYCSAKNAERETRILNREIRGIRERRNGFNRRELRAGEPVWSASGLPAILKTYRLPAFDSAGKPVALHTLRAESSQLAKNSIIGVQRKVYLDLLVLCG